jgi:hypothetical protein
MIWRQQMAITVFLSLIHATLPDTATATVGDDSLIVASLNLAHGRGDSVNQLFVSTPTIRANLGRIAKLLRRERPDLVALQEADGPSRWSGGVDHVAYLAEQAAYPAQVRGQPRPILAVRLRHRVAVQMAVAEQPLRGLRALVANRPQRLRAGAAGARKSNKPTTCNNWQSTPRSRCNTPAPNCSARPSPTRNARWRSSCG